MQHITRTAVRTQAGDLVIKALIRMYKFATKLVKMVWYTDVDVWH